MKVHYCMTQSIMLNFISVELDRLKLAMKNLESDSVDIGNGVFVKKVALSALRGVSGTCNIYGRHVFKHLFQTDEVVGRSLMGKKCNARKDSVFNPAVNEKKRDAIMRKITDKRKFKCL